MSSSSFYRPNCPLNSMQCMQLFRLNIHLLAEPSTQLPSPWICRKCGRIETMQGIWNKQTS